MSLNESIIEKEILLDISNTLKQIDEDLPKLAEFFNNELEYSKNFPREEDIFLLTRLLSKSNSYASQIPEENRKKIYETMGKYKCETNPQLLASMTILRYILKIFYKNAGELGFKKEILAILEEKAINQYKAFRKQW